MTGHGLRVLVVEDNESVRRTIRQLLQSQAGIEITREAVDDVVLLDLTMPNMNAWKQPTFSNTSFLRCTLSSSVNTTPGDSSGLPWRRA